MANFSSFSAQVGAKVIPSELQAELNKLKPTVTVTPIMNTKGQQVYTKEVQKFTSANGELVEVTKKVNTATGEATSSITKYQKNVKKATDNTANMSKGVKTLSGRFVDITKKVVAFGAVTSLIGTFTGLIYKAVDAVKDYNSAQVEFNKVTELGTEEAKAYAESLGEVGEAVGRTRTELLESATEFAKAGFTEEESAQLAEVSALYQNTADEILSASEASSVLISQLKAFNITAEDSISVIDSINGVDVYLPSQLEIAG